MLEQNLDKIYWRNLSENLNAIHLILRLDFKKMKKQCKPFSKELVSYVFNPLRIERMSEMYRLEMEAHYKKCGCICGNIESSFMYHADRNLSNLKKVKKQINRRGRVESLKRHRLYCMFNYL